MSAAFDTITVSSDSREDIVEFLTFCSNRRLLSCTDRKRADVRRTPRSSSSSGIACTVLTQTMEISDLSVIQISIEAKTIIRARKTPIASAKNAHTLNGIFNLMN
jgi:hypothetical protein